MKLFTDVKFSYAQYIKELDDFKKSLISIAKS